MNKPLDLDKVVDFNTYKDSQLKHDTIESEREVKTMKTEDNYSKTKMNSKFEQLNQKIDYSVQHILSETKNMFLEQQIKEKTERENERKSTNRWLIGIAISLAGLIISIIVNFFLKK